MKLTSNKSFSLTNFGFTLIELLAVIIILSIVALIATPIILDVVEDARISAGKSESNMIYSGINNYCASINMKKQMGTLDSEDVDCTTKTTFTDEELSKMVNLGNADIKEIAYDGEKLTALVIESNNHIFKLCDGTFVMDSDCETSSQPDTGYTDNSGANSPELLNNMVPIKYENDNWIVADISQEWYDYDSKEWANAVVLNKTKNVGDIVNEEDIDLWYVWIPRYKYKLFNANNEGVPEQEIEIEFESGTSTTGTVKCTDNISGTDGTTSSQTCTNATNGSWYTHPAFTFGTQELKGFWVGKFEVSTIDSTCNNSPNDTNCNKNSHQLIIKPNVMSLRYTSVSNLFIAILNIGDTYNLNGDSHMMKNMEWGAVAYLSHSKYGINEEVYINNSSSSYTGRSGGNVGGSINTVATQYPSDSTSSNKYYNYGYYTYDGKIVNYDGSIGSYVNDRTLGTKASTTGNVYGVYDMSGGAWEYVMGNMVDSSGNFYSSSSGFSNVLDLKYYDSYSYGTSDVNHGRGKLGDATKEILNTFGTTTGGWYNDSTGFGYSSYSWFYRGGCFNSYSSRAGGFTFSVYDGRQISTISSRAILCVEK